MTALLRLPLNALKKGWVRFGAFSRIDIQPMIAVAVVAFAGCALVAYARGMPEPLYHDEFSYLLAADTFAHGRLTNPTHPLWAHFETFHVIQQPTYMSKYFPAQGAFLALGKVLFGHPVFGVWISYSLMCAGIWWMLRACVPPRWALVGGLIAIGHPQFGISSYWAQSYWGGAVAGLGGALFFGALLRIVKKPRATIAGVAAIGLFLLVNSRPWEGAVIAIPALGAFFYWIFRKCKHSTTTIVSRIIAPAAVILFAGLLFMGYYNYRITGNPVQLPYRLYEERYTSTPNFIWQEARPVPAYRHAVMREFNKKFNEQQFDRYKSLPLAWGTITMTTISYWLFFFGTFPWYPWLLALPVLVPRPRIIASYALILTAMAGSCASSWFFPHYAAAVTCVAILVMVEALRGLYCLKVNNRAIGRSMAVMGALLLIFYAGPATMTYNYFLKIGAKEARVPTESRWYLDRAELIETLKKDGKKHLIIVSYGRKHFYHYEWVYNEADIDNAPVVWARKMSTAEDQELIGYFKDRKVWYLRVDDNFHSPHPVPYS